MEYFNTDKGSLASFLARIEDLRLLLDLEARALVGHRLDVSRTVTLQSLREFYPGSARRFRDELLMQEHDDEALLIFALESEDQECSDTVGQVEKDSIPDNVMDLKISSGEPDDPSV